MKYLKNRKLIISSVLILLVIATIAFQIVSEKTTMNLTQLSAQGSRQMMGYVMKTNKGKLIVVDGGTIEDTDNLIKYINKNGRKVDYWFLTHAHDDHVGAFTKIINNTEIQVQNIYASTNELSWYEENEPQRIEFTKTYLETLEKLDDKVVSPKINDIINIDNITVEVLGIRNPEITENSGNEQSMVLKFNTGKTSILILGDTGIKSSEKLLNTQKEKLKSDIVQIAHHGQAGATKELYEAVKPTKCLWPTTSWLWDNDVGEGINTGPWKTFETRKWIEELNVKQNYIAKDGDITIKIK